jgi:hypothetical protein
MTSAVNAMSGSPRVSWGNDEEGESLEETQTRRRERVSVRLTPSCKQRGFSWRKASKSRPVEVATGLPVSDRRSNGKGACVLTMSWDCYEKWETLGRRRTLDSAAG